jgi:hypothetical protein
VRARCRRLVIGPSKTAGPEQLGLAWPVWYAGAVALDLEFWMALPCPTPTFFCFSLFFFRQVGLSFPLKKGWSFFFF